MPASYPFTRSLVRALRIKSGLTQEQLAEKAKVDYKYYQRFELGDTPDPSLDILERIGAVFGLPPWVLICTDEALAFRRARLSQEDVARAKHQGRGRPKKTPMPQNLITSRYFY